MTSVKVKTEDVLAGAEGYRQYLFDQHAQSIKDYNTRLEAWLIVTRSKLDKIKSGAVPANGYYFDLPDQPRYPGNEPAAYTVKEVDNHIAMLRAETRSELSISDSSSFVGYLKYIPKK